MQYVSLGRSGLKVSRIALGCMSFGVQARQWRLGAAAAAPFIERALDLGINFFDTADMYGAGESEQFLGQVLLDRVPRDEVVLATKVFYPVRPGPNGGGLSRKAIMASIDASLQRLRTDHVDLYQIHRWDAETPIEETMEALHDVVKAGKARYLGASSMWTWQFSRAQHAARLRGQTAFISMQPHYNLLNREEERDMLPFCEAEGVGVLPWSPLARGLLARPWGAVSESGRPQHDRTAAALYGASADQDRPVIDALDACAQARGLPLAQVALAWLLHDRRVTAPVIGATRIEHIDHACAALELGLSPEDRAALERPYRPRPWSFAEP